MITRSAGLFQRYVAKTAEAVLEFRRKLSSVSLATQQRTQQMQASGIRHAKQRHDQIIRNLEGQPTHDFFIERGYQGASDAIGADRHHKRRSNAYETLLQIVSECRNALA